jgi:hypothetical protein|nr:hypothetical protein [Aeromicrobium sp.]
MSRDRRNVALLVGAIALVVFGWTSSGGDQEPAASSQDAPAIPPIAPAPEATAPDVTAGVSSDLAIDALTRLAVKGRAPKTGYSREQFGQAWRDLDRNGCDQRNDVLRRDLSEVAVKPGTRGCVVLTGVLTSPYSGESVRFTRGSDTSWQVPIDHVVALSDAWQKGAQQWDAAQREAFANDFLELRATDVTTNSSKSDSDAASWLPPLKSSRCDLVARQVAVKTKYALWVTQAEHDAMGRVLGACPGQRLASSADIPLAPF